MKKLLLFFGLMLFSFGLSAQVIFFVEEPESLSDNYALTFADSAGVDWDVPDLENPDNAILDTLVFVSPADGDLLGCAPGDVTGDVDGQIAVVRRGDCQFGTKAFNAQMAGARACVIINNVPGAPVGMAGGDDGPNVTIPTVMISQGAGEDLASEIEAGNVVAFIGNKINYYDYDVGAKNRYLLRAPQFSTPSAIANDGGEYSVDIGTYIYNFGSEDQTNVSLNVTISVDGNEVYNETSDPADIPSGDSLLYSLEAFAPDNYETGYYEMTYNISSDDEDEFPDDNAVSADFAIDDEMLTFGRVDQNLDSVQGQQFYQPGDFGAAQVWRMCSHFRDPNASRLAATGMSFSCSTSEGELTGEFVEIFLYEWNDEFEDVNSDEFNSIFDNDNLDLETIGSGAYSFDTDQQNETVTAEFEEAPVELEDNQRYLYCMTLQGNVKFLGFSNNIDYWWTYNQNLQPLFPLDSDGAWFPLGFGSEIVPSVALNTTDVSSVTELSKINITPYPNPANSRVRIPYDGNASMANMEVYDLAGKLVKSDRVNFYGSNFIDVDVSDMANGTYVFDMKFNDGTQGTFRVVISK